MRLTFIITIDPVKDRSLLDVLLHSLNLQTRKNFDVVFYNQTKANQEELFSESRVQPDFEYRFFSVAPENFLGKFPLWDLYSFHQQLLNDDLVGDYFMSLHMEEFPDPSYVENVTKVLERARLHILFGNLSRTHFYPKKIAGILNARTAGEFEDFLGARGLKNVSHWAFRARYPTVILKQFGSLFDFGFKTRLRPNRNGYRILPRYYEDLYFMSKQFAHRYNWFLPGRPMYFEDVHICEKPGVCELAGEIAKLTEFPAYFNLGRIYHLNHAKFYYQLQDREFGDELLALDSREVSIQNLQRAVSMYRAGSSLEDALSYTRRNAERTGTQNLNFRYHMEMIDDALGRSVKAPKERGH
jgi:hypothetical protein